MRHRFRRWGIVLRKVLRRIVYARGSSQSIAFGVALGVFIGFTPTAGFQMLLAAFLATLLGVNRLAAILPVWISNPFTIAPIYYYGFRVGAAILRVEDVGAVRERFVALGERISAVSLGDFAGTVGAVVGEMGRLGFDILVPLIAGSIILGLVGAAVSYPVALWSVSFVRGRRRAYSIHRAEARLSRLEQEGLYLKTDTGSWKPVESRPSAADGRPREDDGRRPLGPIGGRERPLTGDDRGSAPAGDVGPRG